MSENATREPELVYATLGQRYLAQLLDSLVLVPLLASEYFLMEWSRQGSALWLGPGLLFLIWFEVGLVVRYGATPGKLLMKIRIAMVDGSSVTWKAALLRFSVTCVLSAAVSCAFAVAASRMTDAEYFELSYLERYLRLRELTPGWYGPAATLQTLWGWSELLVILFNKKRRSLHDFLAGTVVVQKPAEKQTTVRSRISTFSR